MKQKAERYRLISIDLSPGNICFAASIGANAIKSGFPSDVAEVRVQERRVLVFYRSGAVHDVTPERFITLQRIR